MGTLTENRNSYLDQVVAQQEQLESDLRAKGRISASYSPKPAPPGAPAPQAAFGGAALYFATRDNSPDTIHLQLQVPR